jgi:dTDP-4-dehydrorhamnose reductase
VRILLSGKTGQLGRALGSALTNIGDLTVLGRDEFDLTSQPSMRRTLNEIRPDLIVNAAAYTAVDKAESERDLAMAVNGEAPGFMASWAAENDAAILHYSTDYVFDGTATEPYREDDAPNPINIYGETKRAGEIAVTKARAPHLIIRTSWVYDAEGSNFLRTILRLARERTNLQIVNDQRGAPTPTWWLAETSKRIISTSSGNDLFGKGRSRLLHAAPTGVTSWHGFATAIIDEMRRRSYNFAVETIEPIPTSGYPTPAARPLNSALCLDRLRQNFGITPPTWRDALAPVIDRLVQIEGKP